jgi:hypothetical protein
VISKKGAKDRAIKLRQQGKTYSEILEVVPVAKSTLSLWLREVGLSKTQKQALTKKKHAAQLRGAARRKEIRLAETAQIHTLCKKDITGINKRELFLIGVALYWAEGTKRSGERSGIAVDFANSDPQMIKIFVKWLVACCNVSEDEIELRLHIHLSHKYREDTIKEIWTKEVGLKKPTFTKTLYKKHNPKSVRHKTDESYIGLVSVRVKKSTVLHRRIMGWIYAIIATQN